ncbi:SpoIIE family protein phosphatase [Desulfobacterales bacterium HSG2]|nr:SpoIIE family protein phosphatase [Desulfobacterales bacterium HSG2]
MTERKHEQRVSDKDKFTFPDEGEDKFTFPDEGEDKFTFPDEGEDKFTSPDERGDKPVFTDERGDKPVFTDECEDKPGKPVFTDTDEQDAWTVMIADDEKSVHDMTQRLLRKFSFEGRGIRFLSAYSGEEAKAMIREHPETALILLDVVMETDHAGLDVVRHIRETLGNDLLQIVLRTGQPGQAPEMSVIAKYSINDYRSKTEMTMEKLFTAVTTSLRAYRLTQNLKKEMAERMKAETEAKLLAQEMELARHIQSSLIPEKPELSGYDIAASIDPADEVGGDYYDVISVAGHNWIVVGDVSGHGVTAGLVMMMVQTAIHTVLAGNPETPPSLLLSVINRTIFENIEKMDDSKHMTIIVLAGGKDGKFSFAGLHEDILIRRAATGKVEAVETDGMWIGLEDDISEMLSDDTLILEPGDCMVLFTDGITEARGGENSLFGDERLIRIIEESGDGPASQVHRNIITELEPWRKPDDVTLVVVKRV